VVNVGRSSCGKHERIERLSKKGAAIAKGNQDVAKNGLKEKNIQREYIDDRKSYGWYEKGVRTDRF